MSQCAIVYVIIYDVHTVLVQYVQACMHVHVLYMHLYSYTPNQVENNRSELLQHPLVTSLLTHKWNQFGAWMFFINLLFYLVYIIFLTAFALTVPNPQNEMCKFVTIQGFIQTFWQGGAKWSFCNVGGGGRVSHHVDRSEV